MKTTLKTLICALVLGTTVAFAGPGSDAKKPTSFATGIYVSKNGTLNVSIEKKGAAYTSLYIADAKGDVLVRENLSRKQSGASYKFDVSNLPDGAYEVVVVSKQEKQQTPFSISSEQRKVQRHISFE